MRSIEQKLLFGKYRILEQLGEGAGSQVYLAEHLKLKTCRAIKRICKAHPLQSQFRLEANLLKSLSHPSIPIIYDIEEDEEYIYIIEEYVEGESLQEYLLYHDSVSQEFLMQLGIRLCDVFAYLHSREPYPVCYKDLKPEHIILCGDTVKIIDFGIASYIISQGKNFQNNEKTCDVPEESLEGYGTVGYAAPEQFRGEVLTPAADLYALGRVLQQLEKHTKDHSRNINRIIRKTTAEDIGGRYASAMELKEALEEEMERVCPKSMEKKHLYYQIAVTGAKSGVGTTHLALALTAYLNRQGIPGIYQSKEEKDTLEALIRRRKVTEEADGIYVGEYFRGILKGNEAGADGCYVMDFGARLTDCIAEEAECTILVVGGSAWEEECALKAIAALRAVSKLIIVCNHNHRRICRKYADASGRKVYCFPFDENPFAVTKKKQRLFTKILCMNQDTKGGMHDFFQNGKARTKNNRDSRGRTGDGSNTSGGCLGKLQRLTRKKKNGDSGIKRESQF